jgi:PAS domain S-box-containing protein
MAILDKTQISRIIYLGFGLVILLILIQAISAIIALEKNHKTLDLIVTVNNTKIKLIHTMQLAGRNRMIALDAMTLEKDAFKQDDYARKFSQYALDFGNARKKLTDLKLSDSEKRLLQQQSLSAIKAMKIQNRVHELALAERQSEAINLLINDGLLAQNLTFSLLDQLVQDIDNSNRETENIAETVSHNSILLIYTSLTVVILLSVLIAFFIQRRLTNLFSKLDQQSTEISYQKKALDEHSIVSITDKHGAIIYTNNKFEHISQYTNSELLGKNHRILNSGFHDKAFFRTMWNTISKGQIWHGEIKNRAKDGRFYWVATTIMPFLDKEGKPERFVSIRTDITRVKQAETDLLNLNKKLELRVAERTAKLENINIEIEHDKKVLEVVTKSTLGVKGDVFFKTLVNCMAAALNVRCALVSKITDINNASSRTVAVWAKDHFEDNIDVLMSDAASYDVLSGSIAYFPEKVKELFPKRTFYAEQNIESYLALPFNNSNGEIIGFLAIMDDKPLIGIHKIRHTLGLFAMRTGAELELQSNEKALADAYRHKSEFLANMSHELRTPLNAIIGFSKHLIDGLAGPVNDQQKQNLDLIQRGGKHLLMLISEILDMSKVEAGKMDIKLQATELHTFFDDIIANVSSLANEKDLQLIIELNTDVITEACFDRLRIKQVLLNLLSNAIKFTEQGNVTILCDMVDNHIDLLPAHRQQEIKNSQTPYLLIAVTDTGMGIDANNLDMIFEEFRQVDGSSTRSQGGTGLGLAISRKMVELHHGEIWASNTFGRGSTFAFILPLFGIDDSESE